MNELNVTLERVGKTNVDFIYVNHRRVGQVDRTGKVLRGYDWHDITPQRASQIDAPVMLLRELSQRVRAAIAQKIADEHSRRDEIVFISPPKITQTDMVERFLRERHM